MANAETPRHREGEASGRFELSEGDEFWSVLILGGSWTDMSPSRAAGLVSQADDYWRGWLGDLQAAGRRAERAAIGTHDPSLELRSGRFDRRGPDDVAPGANWRRLERRLSFQLGS